ncbi:MAG: hydantoinase B/oxoprolinase family protein [Acidobacteriota bacterium]
MTGPSRQHAAVRNELFRNRFSAIAEEMGEMLQRMALSTNVKERLDFSCALLDERGRLVVNAPHIPVHLGALGVCVRRVAHELELQPGDVVVTNHPGYGGSHLPDVTLITPIFVGERLLGFAASRAHHAELGGVRPGSMPPHATRLSEEGIVLEPFKLVIGGRSNYEEMERRLSDSAYPSRSPEENLADLRAAQAANQRGAEALRALAREHGAETIASQMQELFERARRRTAARLMDWIGLDETVVERLDDGSELAVRVEVYAGDEGARARFDFEGTATQHPGNFNATSAIVRSAVLYVLRLAVDEPLPLNEGMLADVELLLPPGSMLDPHFPEDPAECPAVVGGNVETSQRLVDALIRALGLMAGSQGTMNNVIFGTNRFGYYETICGGAGASEGCVGASAVQVHMTNTRMTDPEVLELRYPVRLEEFRVRRGSGGRGRHQGGDGCLRAIRFLEAAELSVLTQHRVEEPYGGEGGEPGDRGRQWIETVDGRRVDLGPSDAVEVSAGDRLVIETPGGGGWGRADAE